jgi:hypothetical protein
MGVAIASLWWSLLGALVPREPTRCPYCPARPEVHWIHWGTYRRSVHDLAGWIRVVRYFCKFTRRTFSLLPDGLLPYRRYRAAAILHHLRALVVEAARQTPAMPDGSGLQIRADEWLFEYGIAYVMTAYWEHAGTPQIRVTRQTWRAA